MGYRSDVAYIIAFHHTDFPEKAHADFVAFHEWVKQYTVDEEEGVAHKAASPQYGIDRVQEDCDHFKFYPQEGVLLMRWEHVKWYPNYPETRWHTGLLETCLGYQTGAYRFVRIGEEFDDVEVTEEGDNDGKGYSLYEWVDVIRSINFSSPREYIHKEIA